MSDIGFTLLKNAELQREDEAKRPSSVSNRQIAASGAALMIPGSQVLTACSQERINEIGEVAKDIDWTDGVWVDQDKRSYMIGDRDQETLLFTANRNAGNRLVISRFVKKEGSLPVLETKEIYKCLSEESSDRKCILFDKISKFQNSQKDHSDVDVIVLIAIQEVFGKKNLGIKPKAIPNTADRSTTSHPDVEFVVVKHNETDLNNPPNEESESKRIDTSANLDSSKTKANDQIPPTSNYKPVENLASKKPSSDSSTNTSNAKHDTSRVLENNDAGHSETMDEGISKGKEDSFLNANFVHSKKQNLSTAKTPTKVDPSKAKDGQSQSANNNAKQDGNSVPDKSASGSSTKTSSSAPKTPAKNDPPKANDDQSQSTDDQVAKSVPASSTCKKNSSSSKGGVLEKKSPGTGAMKPEEGPCSQLKNWFLSCCRK